MSYVGSVVKSGFINGYTGYGHKSTFNYYGKKLWKRVEMVTMMKVTKVEQFQFFGIKIFCNTHIENV